MTSYEDRAGLKVAAELAALIEQDVLPGLGLDPADFWSGAADVFARFAPENRALLARRDDLQARIDAWHAARRGQLPFVEVSTAFGIGERVDGRGVEFCRDMFFDDLVAHLEKTRASRSSQR